MRTEDKYQNILFIQCETKNTKPIEEKSKQQQQKMSSKRERYLHLWL